MAWADNVSKLDCINIALPAFERQFAFHMSNFFLLFSIISSNVTLFTLPLKISQHIYFSMDSFIEMFKLDVTCSLTLHVLPLEKTIKDL